MAETLTHHFSCHKLIFLDFFIKIFDIFYEFHAKYCVRVKEGYYKPAVKSLNILTCTNKSKYTYEV